MLTGQRGVMMKKTVLTFLVFLVLAGPIVCHANDGNALLEHCSAAVQRLDGQTNVNAIRFGYCYGYIQGIIDMNTFNKNAGQSPLFCLPPHVSNGRIARLLFEYLQNHTERLQEEARVLIVDAYAEAFPCK
jgi:hypothetical protein